MSIKKQKVKEGDLFAVPLDDGSFGIGLLTRINKNAYLGFFFKKKYAELPNEVQHTEVDINKVALAGQFSTLGIRKGEWTIVKSSFIFHREEWPIPVFFRKNLLTDEYSAIVYDDTLFNCEKYSITEEQAKKLYEDAQYGYVALQTILSRRLQHESVE